MMAEETWHLTPYQFGGNDPISYNDPTGLLYNLGMSNKGSATPILDGWNTGADQMARADRPDPWGNLYGGSSGGGITPIYDDKGQVIGLNLGAQAAQAFTRAFQYAYNHPNDQGEWSVSFGTNKDGEIGYWMPYSYFVNDGHIDKVDNGVPGERTSNVEFFDTYITGGRKFVRFDQENHNYLCGSNYNWKKIGDMNYTQFAGLGFMLVHTDGQILSVGFGSVCIGLSTNLVYTKHQADMAWNKAWNTAMDQLVYEVNFKRLALGDEILKARLKTIIVEYLTLNYGTGFSFSSVCSGVPYSKATYCTEPPY